MITITAKEWREMKGWSQLHLASVLKKKTGDDKISQAHVSQWENGTTTPDYVAQVMLKLSAGRISYVKKAEA